MTRPTTADEAAAVLVGYAHLADNLTAPWDDGDPDHLDTWEALTRFPGDDVEFGPHRSTIGAARHRARVHHLTRAGVDLLLPSVVVMLPRAYLPHGWSLLAADPFASTLNEDGYGGWQFRIHDPVRPNRRPRIAIVGDADNLPPVPSTSRALALGVLACRRAARALDLWRTDSRTARKTRAEAAAYRAHGDHLEALLPASFAWLDHADPPDVVVPAIGSVPAVLRATT